MVEHWIIQYFLPFSPILLPVILMQQTTSSFPIRNGPRTNPRGAYDATLATAEECRPSLTWCFLSVKYERCLIIAVNSGWPQAADCPATYDDNLTSCKGSEDVESNHNGKLPVIVSHMECPAWRVTGLCRSCQNQPSMAGTAQGQVAQSSLRLSIGWISYDGWYGWTGRLYILRQWQNLCCLALNWKTTSGEQHVGHAGLQLSTQRRPRRT